MPTMLDMAKERKRPTSEPVSVRIQTDLLDKLERLMESMSPQPTTSYLINIAVAEYIARKEAEGIMPKPRR